MNLDDVEKINESIIENAKSWAKGEECDPLVAYDIVVLGEYLKIRIPACFRNFVRSEKYGCAKVCGAEKTIFKTLDKIQNKLMTI